MFIVVSGKSGAGKTELVKEVCKQMNLKRAVTYTTRPKRDGEVDGVDYNFVTEDVFNSLSLVAKETIYTEDKGVWRYGLDPRDIKEKDIAILNPKGIFDLRNNNFITDNIYDIEIRVHDLIRLQRIEKRKDNQTEVEKTRRFIDDNNLFEDYYPFVTSDNNRTFKEGLDMLIYNINLIKFLCK